MPHTGVEQKPPWSDVPLRVRHAVREHLGSPVVRGARVWGGYGPAPSFRLLLADGRRAFLKATYPATNEFSRSALLREERVYRELGDAISRWAPAYYAAFVEDEWRILLLEDVGPRSVPPWTRAFARVIMHAYADFHASTNGVSLPSWLPRHDSSNLTTTWSTLAERTDELRIVAALSGERQCDARHWFRTALPVLSNAGDSIVHAGPPYSLLHLDTRSDNLRWRHGRLRLFDWPFASVGPAELDVAMFAQSITTEGGPDPEQIVARYEERNPLRHDVLRAAVASVAAFFASVAWQPEIPDLPRVRSFQRRQLRVSVAWASRLLALPEPTWLEGVTG